MYPINSHTSNVPEISVSNKPKLPLLPQVHLLPPPVPACALLMQLWTFQTTLWIIRVLKLKTLVGHSPRLPPMNGHWQVQDKCGIPILLPSHLLLLLLGVCGSNKASQLVDKSSASSSALTHPAWIPLRTCLPWAAPARSLLSSISNKRAAEPLVQILPTQ
jgi:hypothetical protein